MGNKNSLMWLVLQIHLVTFGAFYTSLNQGRKSALKLNLFLQTNLPRFLRHVYHRL